MNAAPAFAMDAQFVAELSTIKTVMEEAAAAMALATEQIAQLTRANARMATALRDIAEEADDRYDGAPDAGPMARWAGHLMSLALRGLGEA
ncbi:MAG TPA: hypothetical protein VFB37_09935 [Steroidobacteraceae bacterium]|nr:hypothetical protein [Steroidobacteraceae bacterium]